MSNVLQFPIKGVPIRADHTAATFAKQKWSNFIGIGISETGEITVMNNRMSKERALWLLENAKRKLT